MHEQLMEKAERLRSRMEQLNYLLDSVSIIENEELLGYILEDISKASDAVRVVCGTCMWAYKDLDD